MFDRHFHDHNTHVSSGPSRVDVHEHRAPTDDSVRLLSEMEEKVRKRVIQSQVIEANNVKGAITHMRSVIGGSELFVSFSIDGKREDVRVELKDDLLLSAEDYANKLLIEVSIAIARKLLLECEDVRGELERRLKWA